MSHAFWRAQVNSTLSATDFAALVADFDKAFAAIESSLATTPHSTVDYSQDPAIMLTDMCCNPQHVVCRCNVSEA